MRSFNVDDQLKDKEVIKKSLIKICKRKKRKRRGRNRKYNQAQYILKNVDIYVDETLEIILAFETMMLCVEKGEDVPPEVMEKAFKPKRCPEFEVVDGPSKKKRSITSVPLFPDQVIHQLLITVGEPVYMHGMYEYSCGSIPKRGLHKGVKYLKRTIKHHRKHDKSAIKIGAQLDITKCYQSISHEHLKGLIREKFRGKLYVWLSFAVIDSYYFIEIDGKYYGVPIGYSTSQWWCNFDLTPLDHYIKEELKVEYYIRYIDDMILFGRAKRALHEVVRKISEYAISIGLKIKYNWQVFRFDYTDKIGKRRGRAFDTLGYRFFRDKIILRKRLALTIRRQVQRVSNMKKVVANVAQSLMSRLGWLKHCNSLNFYMKHVKPYINIRKLKGVISNESKLRHKAIGAV